MSLTQLLKIIPAPESPVCTGVGQDWEATEDDLGTRLPADYRNLIRVYGYGGFCGTIGIVSPFGGKTGLKSEHESQSRFFRNMLASYGDSKFSVYPDEGGILYVGGDEFTNSLTWLTQGPPDEWPLIWFDDHMYEHERFDMRITEFLYEWAWGRITPKVHAGLFKKPPLERGALFRPAPVCNVSGL
jgi:hypothetical protein